MNDNIIVKTKDLTGKRFGRLKVLGRAPDSVDRTTGKRQARFNCQCDCGRTRVVSPYRLTHGTTNSCTCCANKKPISVTHESCEFIYPTDLRWPIPNSGE